MPFSTRTCNRTAPSRIPRGFTVVCNPQGIIALPWFNKSDVILFLNKEDIFRCRPVPTPLSFTRDVAGQSRAASYVSVSLFCREKVVKYDIGKWHKDYDGGLDYDKGLEFITLEYVACVCLCVCVCVCVCLWWGGCVSVRRRRHPISATLA